MGKRTNQIIKAKLYLLAIGILILAMMLVWNRKEEPEQEAEPYIQETEDMQEEPEKEESEEKPLAYTGNIRVLLKTDDFASEYHEAVKAVSDCELAVKGREDGVIYESGTELSFTQEDGCLFLNGEELADVPDCFVLEPENPEEAGTITVESMNRSYGAPSYKGKLEIWVTKAGFVLVNELPLETYLEYVVPSEMPSRYELEALKAQAVCARTYAYKHTKAYGYPEYEAHVDDSVRYQVYNNTAPADSTSQAVRETADLILTSGGQPITAYYFSTSCGYTGNEEVWWDGSAELTPYLRGKTINEAGKTLELTYEDAFENFISQVDESCYDADISWYRWETEVDIQTLSENLNEALKGRYEANPEAVLTKRGREYKSRAVSTIGTIRSIEVLERNEGGAIQKLEITGSKRTIRIETEYNVRALLNVKGGTIVRRDGSTVEGGALLPSAYMTITPIYDEEEKLTGYRFYGGGYGHGVGLSQNGANGMAKQGKGCEEILRFFYTDVELTAISTL